MERVFLHLFVRLSGVFLLFSRLPPEGASPSPAGLDPSIIVAWIGAGSAILVAVIAGIIALYQTQKSARLERERQESEKEMEHFRRKLDKLAQQEERAQQHQEQLEEAARAAMSRARTLEERVIAYRQALQVDPRIARLQILDMTWPLEISDIYVRLRLHQESRPGFQIEREFPTGDILYDPNTLLKRSQFFLEQRVAAALYPEDLLQTTKHCVVVGDPGAGKSTLLKHLALRSIKGELAHLPSLPIHIELQAFASSGHRDLLGFAATQWDERYGFPRDDAHEYLCRILETGQALILLDALDETVTGSNREEAEESYCRVSELITNLATRYPLAPIVVTARKAGYHQRAHLPGFTEVEILDFRQEEIRQFIQRWFAIRRGPQRGGSAPDLLARLERNSRIQALAATPLLLSLIVLVYEEQLDLPERRAELYRQCVDTLLARWDSSRNVRRRREFKPDQKRQLLAEIAWHFHMQGQRYFPESELLARIAAFLPAIGLAAEQNSSVLAEITAENGLLKEQAHGWYGFLHLTLQEYFVAQYAVDHQQMMILLAIRDDPWWEEILLLYAGRIPDASPLLQRLLAEESTSPAQQRHDIFTLDLLLAGRCLGASPTVRQASLRTDIINRLFLLVLTSPYKLTQEQGAKILAEIGGSAIIQQLFALLSDEQVHRQVRESIAVALGNQGDQSIAPRLLTLLSDKQVHQQVRRSIAEALGNLGNRSVVPHLLGMLPDEQVEEIVREKILKALSSLNESSTASQFLTLLADAQLNPLVRVDIAKALGDLGDKSVVPHLVALLLDEQVNAFVRGNIAEALKRLGDKLVTAQFLPLLSNEQVNLWVRWNTARMLGCLGDMPHLLTLLSNEQIEESVRWNIAIALGERGERSVVPDLLALFSNKQINASVRWGIAAALGRLGEKSVVPLLLELLPNEQANLWIRWNSAMALGSLGEESAVPHLLALLPNEQIDEAVCWSSVAALEMLSDQSIIPQLLTLLPNKQINSSIRARMVSIFPTLVESEEQVCALAELLPGSDIANRIHRALWTISRQLGLRIYLRDDLAQKVEVVKLPLTG